MRAARLRHRLNLQQQVVTRDAYGGTTISWTTTATVWGAVEVLTGWEAVSADQISSALQVRVIIRHDSAWSSIDTSWRVEDSNTSRKYGITAVIRAEQRSRPNTVIELMCLESDADDQ